MAWSQMPQAEEALREGSGLYRSVKSDLNESEVSTLTELKKKAEMTPIKYGSLDDVPYQPINLDSINLGEVNIFLLASAIIEKSILLVDMLSIQQRLRIKQKIEQQLKLAFTGVKERLKKVKDQVGAMLESGKLQIEYGKKIMKLTKIQYKLKLSQAAAQALEGFSRFFLDVPFPVATILGAQADLVGGGIQILNMVVNGQVEMKQAKSTMLGAEADSIDRVYSSYSQKLSGEQSLLEDLMQRLKNFSDKWGSIWERLTSGAYQSLILN